ncbi:hypothetical protein [Facklamia hominis]|nr:hypothetical protein [Facklamia hominis]
MNQRIQYYPLLQLTKSSPQSIRFRLDLLITINHINGLAFKHIAQ